MKREIKFRAWDKINKRFLEIKSLEFNLEGELTTNFPIALNGRKKYQIGKQVELMQFTGLRDKNGKEIYAGDLIKHFDKGQISLVEWSSGAWGWYMKSVKNWNPKTGFDSSLDEVIGNIYESKHLLDNTYTDHSSR